MLDKTNTSNVLVLHVTKKVFDLLKSQKKTCEYRPQTRYYMSRLEKLRDWLKWCDWCNLPRNCFVDFRKAYLPKESHDSWYFAKIRRISLVKFGDIPSEDRGLVYEIYKDRFKSGFFKDLLFYFIELEI